MMPITITGQPLPRIIVLLLVFTTFYASFTQAAKTADSIVDVHVNDDPSIVTKEHTKVPLEAHIVSKCPDAADCIHDLIIPTMQNVSDKVDFKLSYIGKLTNHDDGVDCKHGQTECLGDMLELCAADLYPSPRVYLGFTMCLFNDYTHIPSNELVKSCALEHGVDFDKLNDCASKDHGESGMALLRKSVKRSSKAGVETSCTVRLNNTVWCIRDGGEWKDCDDGSKPKNLVKAIEKLYNNSSDETGKTTKEL